MPKGSTWSLEAYRDFSRIAWDVAKLTAEQKEQILHKLNSVGYGFTGEAMRQHFQKMIRDEKAESQQNGASGSSPEANQPATKGKAAAKLRPARGTRAGTKRKTKAPVSDDEENDEKKPVKKRTKKGKTSLKLEEDDEPVASQDDKDWGESAAQLEQHQPMTLFGPFPVPTANEDDDAEQPPRLEEDDSGEA
ncbi:hypothetical protein F5Y00DRAFT_260865 [Daldinia vernicosa]|uniref:uncharacterized protein n=1 Tax=Daldinia vernicosa TaxID=114800 RepID=UPI002008DF57|nr:uncharacterized protein F5Y00DRAFT_260865 [Daldinia vernicosa]KAI0850133.1 hypothetical protein F5Y00DRAFT_260865 [Daldinia vernicosa]